MGPSTREFLSVLFQSGLLPQESVALADQLASQASSGRDLAIELVRRKMLTRWQAEQLLFGRTTFQLGQYVLRRKVGSGATGAVYEARQAGSQKRYAVKVLAPQLSGDREYVARFRREVSLLQTLDHPAVVRCVAAHRIQETEFLVMEFLPGRDLSSWIEARGTISVAAAMRLAERAAEGLAHIHDHGLIHRDIKPSNLIVWTDRPSKSLRLKIVDFGLARHAAGDTAHLTADNRILGSLDFMAPEQFADASRVDIRGDIFSLGATLFTLLTGQHLTDGTSFAEKVSQRVSQEPPAIERLLPTCPRALAGIVNRCLQRDPADRYASPAELTTALRKAIAQPDAHTDDPDSVAAAISQFTAAAPPTDVAVTDDSANDLNDFLSALSTHPTAPTDETVGVPFDTQHTVSGPTARRQRAAKSQRPTRAAGWAVALPLWLAAVGVLASVIGALLAAWVGQADLAIEWPAIEQTAGSTARIGRTNLPMAASGRLSMRLPPGFYAVELQRPGFEPIRQTVELGWAGSVTVSPDWTADPHLSEHRRLKDAATQWAQLTTRRADDSKIRQLRGQLARGLERGAGDESQRQFGRQLLTQLPSELTPRLQEASLPKSRLADGPQGAWKMGARAFQHAGRVSDMCFSPDERVLATGGADGCLKLWSMSDGGLLQQFSSTASLSQMAFAPKSQADVIAAGYTDGRVVVRDLSSDSSTLFDCRAPVTALAYSPDARFLAAGLASNRLQIWNVSAASLTREVSMTHRVHALAWSADNRVLAAADANGVIRLWSRSEDQITDLPKGPPPGRLRFAASTLEMLGANRRRAVWNINEPLQSPQSSAGDSVLDCAADGQWHLQVQGPHPRSLVRIPERDFQVVLDRVPCCGRHAANRQLTAVGYEDGGVEVYTADNERTFGPLPLETRWTSVAISSDASVFALGAGNGRLAIFDAFQRTVLQTPASNGTMQAADCQRHDKAVTFLSFCDNDRVLVSHDGTSLSITDVADINAHQSFAAAAPVCCHRSGHTVAFRRGNELVLYAVRTDTEKTVAVKGERWLARFSPDGRFLAVQADGRLSVLDTETAELAEPSQPNEANIRLMSWLSSDRIFTVSEAGTGMIVSRGSPSRLEVVDTFPGVAPRAVFHEGVVLLAEGRLTRITPLGLAKPITPMLTPPDAPLADFALSPAARMAIVIGSDGTLTAFPVDSGAPR